DYSSITQFSRTFYKDLREFRYLRLIRASVSYTREPMKPEPRTSSGQGLASAVNLARALITSQTPLAKHASFSGSLAAEVSSLCVSTVCLMVDFPQTERQRAARNCQRGSRSPRPPDALAFCLRYSA